jgi:hypothetical protein
VHVGVAGSGLIVEIATLGAKLFTLALVPALSPIAIGTPTAIATMPANNIAIILFFVFIFFFYHLLFFFIQNFSWKEKLYQKNFFVFLLAQVFFSKEKV